MDFLRSKWHVDHKLGCNVDPNDPAGDDDCASIFLAYIYCYFPDCGDPATQFDITNAAYESAIVAQTTNAVGQTVSLKCDNASKKTKKISSCW